MIRDADRSIELDDETVALFHFPRSAVRSVILGMDMGEAEFELFRRALLLPTDYRNKVRVYQCYMDSRSYRLKLGEISLR